VRQFLEGKRRRRQGSSVMMEADDIVKSVAAAGVAEGSGWCFQVEDDQRKLGRWTECAVGPN
jgi:hypothetical protein